MFSFKDFECHINPRHDYRGNLNVTGLRVPCIPWTFSEFPDRAFPENSVSEAKNYCRNPDGRSGPPWCMTHQHDTGQPCDLPKCGMSTFLGYQINIKYSCLRLF